MACMSRQHLPRFDEFSSLDTCLTSGLMPGVPKVRIVWYRDSGLRHSPPQMKDQHVSRRGKLNRPKVCIVQYRDSDLLQMMTAAAVPHPTL